ncbi:MULTISPECIES: hypothetical protein [unclassified Streptomyces]|uniref:hypothetical protein n=1 Tax=unclassified Streptomyces TaxID=2593676 RepID=UPI00368449DB
MRETPVPPTAPHHAGRIRIPRQSEPPAGPLTSEPPLAAAAPLTSEPPLTGAAPLTSEATAPGTAGGTESPGV